MNANSVPVDHLLFANIYYRKEKRSPKLVIESDPEERQLDDKGDLRDLGLISLKIKKEEREDEKSASCISGLFNLECGAFL